MFGTRKICTVCQAPQLDESFTEGEDVCTVCSRKREEQLADFAVLRGDESEDRFSAKLRELKKQDPVITSLADAVKDKIGGVEEYGRMVVEDFKKVRGDDLTEDQKKLHTIQQGPLTKWHSMLIDLFAKRDSMVGDHDSMGELDEEDLQAIVSQGASVRLTIDSQFRMELFKQILEEEPTIADRLIRESGGTELITMGASGDDYDLGGI
jgi:hypothetical protein